MNIIKYFKKKMLSAKKKIFVPVDIDNAEVELQNGEHYLDMNHTEHVYVSVNENDDEHTEIADNSQNKN